MDERSNAQLFDALLDKASEIATSNGHTVLEPFHLLIAIARDPQARSFFDKVEFDFDPEKFPYDQLQKNVEDLAKDYAPYEVTPKNLNKHLSGILHTETIRHIRSSAQNTAKSFERDYVGYMEILNAITNLGDDDSRGCLSAHNLGLDDNTQIMRMMLDDAAEWKPARRKGKEQEPLNEKFEEAVNDNADIKNLKSVLAQRIIGQEDAVMALHKAHRRVLAGLKEANKPKGSYLFAGPTGVGKTEVAKQLANVMNVPLVRFDMSEYQEDYTVSNLIGSAKGYIGHDEGGLLTNKIDENPHAVLLLDEIEKAHPDIFNILLQVLDDGRLTDSHGHTVDFTNVTIIMTSNAGAVDLSQEKKVFGFGNPAKANAEDEEKQTQRSAYDAAIKSTFRPEFRNRLDGVITFDHLSRENVIAVTRIFIEEMNDLPAAEEYNLYFSATEEAIEALVDKGYDRAMGARPIKRMINDKIKDMLADMILDNDLTDSDVVVEYSAADDEFWVDAVPLEAVQSDLKKAAGQKPGINDNNAPHYG